MLKGRNQTSCEQLFNQTNRKQLQVIKKIVELQEINRKHFLREILNVIFCANKSRMSIAYVSL